MDAMARRYKAKAFIAYFQSYSNTHADIHTLKALYDAILPYTRIVGLAIGTRPDCIDEDKLKLISSYAPDRLVWMEYGLQSASDRTQELINRGHDVETFSRAVGLTSTFGLRICAHVIIGLPGEDMVDFLATARLVSSLPVTDIKIHMLYIAKGTTLEHLYREGRYTPMDRESYAQAAACFIAHLREDIVVQRITGDPHEDELVAPSWVLDKRQVLTPCTGKWRAKVCVRAAGIPRHEALWSRPCPRAAACAPLRLHQLAHARSFEAFRRRAVLYRDDQRRGPAREYAQHPVSPEAARRGRPLVAQIFTTSPAMPRMRAYH